MPTINFFYQEEEHSAQLSGLTSSIKEFVAKELSCEDIKLGSEEVSIRLIKTDGKGMLADIETEVTAHAFKERVDNQDVFCLNFRDFLMNNLETKDIRVWLLLPQLGHSWE